MTEHNASAGLDPYLYDTPADTSLAVGSNYEEEDPVNARWRAAQPARAEAAKAEILAHRPMWQEYVAGVNGDSQDQIGEPATSASLTSGPEGNPGS